MSFLEIILVILTLLLSAALHLSIKATLQSRRVKDIHLKARREVTGLLLEALLELADEDTQQRYLKKNLQILDGCLEKIKEL